MNKKELIEKWISEFASNVDEKSLNRCVLSKTNFLWHLFSFELVSAIEGEEAKKAFDNLEYEEAIKFYEESWNKDRINKISIVGKISSKEIDTEEESDVYIVAKDFSWTYVKTHEDGWYGPYFYKKN